MYGDEKREERKKKAKTNVEERRGEERVLRSVVNKIEVFMKKEKGWKVG